MMQSFAVILNRVALLLHGPERVGKGVGQRVKLLVGGNIEAEALRQVFLMAEI